MARTVVGSISGAEDLRVWISLLLNPHWAAARVNEPPIIWKTTCVKLEIGLQQLAECRIRELTNNHGSKR